MRRSSLALVTALALSTALVAVADAKTLRWARAGDSLTLDPHAQNEGPTHTLAHQIYEPLLHRDMAAQIIPGLATSWGPLDGDPTIWEFKLRQGVTFHNGNPFNADDVVFSFNRAKMPDSDMKELLASLGSVKKIDDHTVQFQTVSGGGEEGGEATADAGKPAANPLFPNNLTNLFIMDKEWSEANGVEKPQDFENGEETYAVRNSNGTGAFMLEVREPDAKTVLKQNPNYWGKGEFPMEVTEVIYTPIQNASTRVAALLSGEVDFIQDVPVQDLARVASADGLKVVTAPQNRVIFFGLNVGDADMASDDVEGKNPFADKRVRAAMLMALNRDAIRQVVMRGQSQPAGVIMPPFVNGWSEALDAYPPHDVEKAKALMAEAGYSDGFSVNLNCPNDRYINDEGICQAAVGMFGQIGVKVNLDAKPKAQHFPLINKKETDFYMLGWGVPTFDSEYIFNFLVHTTDEKYGSWNGTRYSNPELDAKIKSLATETDLDTRNATIAEIWKVVQDEIIYLPIHHQVLNWGMADGVGIEVDAEDQPKVKYFTMN